MDTVQTQASMEALGQEKALELPENVDPSKFSEPTIFDVIKAG